MQKKKLNINYLINKIFFFCRYNWRYNCKSSMRNRSRSHVIFIQKWLLFLNVVNFFYITFKIFKMVDKSIKHTKPWCRWSLQMMSLMKLYNWNLFRIIFKFTNSSILFWDLLCICLDLSILKKFIKCYNLRNKRAVLWILMSWKHTLSYKTYNIYFISKANKKLC